MAQNGRPSSGDFTGRQKQQAAKAQAVATDERAAEMSMATAVEHEGELHGIFDPKSGERLSDDAPGPNTAIKVDHEPVAEEERGGFFRGEQVLTGQEPEEEVAPAVVARKTFTTPPQVLRRANVTIRVDQDVDKMTYGMKNGEPDNYSFKEGLAYEVPTPVAEHLNERGLVRQWITA